MDLGAKGRDESDEYQQVNSEPLIRNSFKKRNCEINFCLCPRKIAMPPATFQLLSNESITVTLQCSYFAVICTSLVSIIIQASSIQFELRMITVHDVFAQDRKAEGFQTCFLSEQRVIWYTWDFLQF